MNTILSIILFAAILILAWVIRTATEKLLKIFGRDDNYAINQNQWRGNRVRAAGIGPRKS